MSLISESARVATPFMLIWTRFSLFFENLMRWVSAKSSNGYNSRVITSK